MQSGATKLELSRLSAEVARVPADQGRVAAHTDVASGIPEALWRLDTPLHGSSSPRPAQRATSSSRARRAIAAFAIPAAILILGLFGPRTECLAAEPKVAQTFEVLAIQTGATIADPRVIAKHFDVHPDIARYWLGSIQWSQVAA